MQKLNYPLKKYQKAVEKIVDDNNVLSRVNVTPTKGSIVRFELFAGKEIAPCAIWTIHHSHNHKKEIWSKDDYRKAALNLNCTYEFFIETIESF